MTIENPTVTAALTRLLQLTSPALPIGAYAYSQGLEYAVNAGWVSEKESAQDWILETMHHPLGFLDVPVLARMYQAWQTGDQPALDYWSRFLKASRGSAELQLEDRQQGMALARLLVDLEITEARPWVAHPSSSLALLFSLGAVRWDIPLPNIAAGYLWAWAENQVMAAIKLVPLGQTAGQQILARAAQQIPHVVERGLQCDDQEIGFSTPALSIASALHETQYTRLFRT